MKRLINTHFGFGLAGGLTVGLLGWAAISAGWIDAADEAAISVETAADSDPKLARAWPGKSLSVNDVYSRNAPGVVSISAEQKASAAPFSPLGQPQSSTATGSGFVINDQGNILTNDHVVSGASDISVQIGSETVEATVVGSDPSTDLAVLKLDSGADDLQPLELGSSAEVKVGDPVVAIGSPFGLDRTTTAGIVSGIQRQIKAPSGYAITNAIQTDAPINPGNSGGPLLDSGGRVIGVTSQIQTGAQSGGNVGIGFAIPIDTASQVATQLVTSGRAKHAFLGVSGVALTPAMAQRLGLEADSGALIVSVAPGSPADQAQITAGAAGTRAGLRRPGGTGDVIVAVDDQRVSDMADVVAAVDEKQPGDKLGLTLQSDGTKRTVTVTLADRPTNAPTRSPSG